MLFVLNHGTMHLLVELDLTLTRLRGNISPHRTNFIKHNKSNIAFLNEIIIIFPPFYLSETLY